MAQHFLLSTKARTLSLAKVLRLSDDEAFETFKSIRWAATDGDPVCPKCGCLGAYEISTRHKWKCAECYAQFSVTSGTIFASRKLPIRDLLAAIAIFVNGAKGHSALQLSRDLDVQYKTAFVLTHKLREAMAAEQRDAKIEGVASIDGAYFGGYVKPANERKDRKDRRRKIYQTGKRQAVVVVREHGGETLTHVVQHESDGVGFVIANVAPGTVIHADEASHWDVLEARYLTKRINHSEAYSLNGACTNWAESFFSRIRRAEVGIHHHISGKYLAAYASEMAWREDSRRTSNGEQYLTVTGAALAHPVSRQWKGYWQRRAA